VFLHPPPCAWFRDAQMSASSNFWIIMCYFIWKLGYQFRDFRNWFIQLFGFLGSSTTKMEGVTSNGSTYPSWTGPRADWRAILSSLINARVMDSVGFKPACSCWRHNRQDTTTLATLDTTTMLQLTTLSLVYAGFLFDFFCYLLHCLGRTWDIS